MTLAWDIFVFVCVSLLQTTGYYALRSLLYPSPAPADVKRRSWLLSLAASGTFALLVYPAITLPALAAAFSGPAAFRAFFAVEGPLHRLATLYFLSFLCLDCGIGWLDYRDQLRLDTTWLHHTVIGAFLVVLLRSNACMVFLLAAPFEVPTFILSLGSVLPAYRNDCASHWRGRRARPLSTQRAAQTPCALSRPPPLTPPPPLPASPQSCLARRSSSTASSTRLCSSCTCGWSLTWAR